MVRLPGYCFLQGATGPKGNKGEPGEPGLTGKDVSRNQHCSESGVLPFLNETETQKKHSSVL